jgi:hypothetical protein
MAKTVFSIFESQEATHPIVSRVSTLGLFEPDIIHAANFVENSVACFFDDDGESWEEIFGNDTTSATVIVEVHEPPQIVGRYEVELTRTVEARAYRLESTSEKEDAD